VEQSGTRTPTVDANRFEISYLRAVLSLVRVEQKWNTGGTRLFHLVFHLELRWNTLIQLVRGLAWGAPHRRTTLQPAAAGQQMHGSPADHRAAPGNQRGGQGLPRIPTHYSHFPTHPGYQSRMSIRRYLLLDDVIARVRLSRSTIYRQMAAGAFPSPYSLTEHRSGWLESEIDEWCASREKRTLGNRVSRRPPRP
jgi:prophage regulatory protein